MTTFVAWLGVDSRGPASIYFASDSRVSWGSNLAWDHGRKLFACRRYPDILGYIGDVLFPSQVLGQLVDIIDADLLFGSSDSPESRWMKIASIVQDSFGTYPASKSSDFTIVYCTRESSGMTSVFHMCTLNWTQDGGWVNRVSIDLPGESGGIRVYGSGQESMRKWCSYWSKTKQGRTSRSVFSAFCDGLASGEDRQSGGAPQLVGIYRQGAAETFGVVYNSKRYIYGIPVDASDRLGAVEWRNGLFERCDSRTMQRLEGAQRHPRPRGLGKA
jgi:hypothetical protein